MKKYVLFLFLQFISVFFISFLSFLLRPVSVLYDILVYIFVPLFSSFTSLKIVRKGINPYLTWILPPAAETLAGFLVSLGFGPNPLPVMITAFISLVGSAAGDVLNKQYKKGKK